MPPLPDAAELPFPPRREFPITPPDPATPQHVIDAFLALARDRAFSYHVEGVSRWLVDGAEDVSAMALDHAGDGLYVVLNGGRGGEAIVRGSVAVGRQGDEEWQPIDGEGLRQLYDLSRTVVLGDLGPEPDGTGYRLVVDSGFDSFPASVAAAGRLGSVNRVTELVVDELGRPTRLTFHQWSDPVVVGEEDLPEGVAIYTFVRVGDQLLIPALPVGHDEMPSTERTAPAEIVTQVPGVDATVVMPAVAAPIDGDDARWGGADYGYAGAVAALAARTENGGHFEVGSATVAAGARERNTAEEYLDGLRGNMMSRLSGNDDLFGYRRVDVAGATAQEFVAEGTDERRMVIMHRIRIVVIGDWTVVLRVSGPPEVVGSAEADLFLASLSR